MRKTAFHDGMDIIFGSLTGYPCCFSNMHQGWPKFTQSLWFATSDQGIAALAYSPSEVTMKVGEGSRIRIVEDTFYPMDIRYSLQSVSRTRRIRRKLLSFHFICGYRDGVTRL